MNSSNNSVNKSKLEDENQSKQLISEGNDEFGQNGSSSKKYNRNNDIQEDDTDS